MTNHIKVFVSKVIKSNEARKISELRSMTTPSIDLEAEKQEILRRYRGLLRAATHSKSRADRKAIRKAFDISLEAHKDMRR